MEKQKQHFVSKETTTPNLSQLKRQRMLTFLETLRKEHADDESIRAFTEIENYIREKKYGLVWEEHEERVDEMLRTHIPVFKEDSKRKITTSTDDTYNFILEGDNLQSLYLLEKTHKGRVDVIYIDPPYNTKNKDFIYGDKRIDATDGFQHSKWLSFMSVRLKVAERLLAPKGVMAISIGYHEVNGLMFLCQELFPTRQVVCVTVQTSSGNAVTNGFTTVQEYLIFITPKEFEPFEIEDDKKEYSNPYHGMTLSGFNQTQRPNQAYPIFIDGNGCIVGCGKSLDERIKDGTYKGLTSDFIFDYSEAPKGCTAVWPITKSGDPCVWRLIPEKLMLNWNKGYIKIIPNKKGLNKYIVQYLSKGIINQIEENILETKQIDLTKPTLEVIGFKTAANGIPTIWSNNRYLTTSGSKDIKKVFGKKVEFPFPKPVSLVKDFLKRVSHKNSLVLDFFAGSGTTAQAVLELNQEEDGAQRCFILCTNNEMSEKKQIDYFVEKKLISTPPKSGEKKKTEWNEKWNSLKNSKEYCEVIECKEFQSLGICHSVTYPRIKTVVTGIRQDGSKYSDGIPANLKYFKCDWTLRKPEDYLLSNALCLHIREMIELQNGIEIDNIHNVLILNKDDFNKYVTNNTLIENVWVNQNVVFNSKEMKQLNALGFNYIPKDFFGQELREAAE